MSTSTDTQPELVEQCHQFLKRYYREEIGELAQKYPKEQSSLFVDWQDLFQFDPDLGDDYLKDPNQIRDHLELALADFDLPIDIDLSDAEVRVRNLHEGDVYHVGEPRSEHIGDYIGVYGQVQKISDVKPRPDELAFECQVCGTLSYIPQGGDEVQEPHECEGCDRQGPFDIRLEQSDFTDFQTVRIQQPPETTKGGRGSTIDVTLTRDAVEGCEAGDRVTIAGEFSVDEADDNLAFTPYLKGRAVDVEETDYEEITIDDELEERIQSIVEGERGSPFELLVDSIAPHHHGDQDIKLAIALQMFGGTRAEQETGDVERGDSHILLLGDPGTGKSSLLRAVDNLAPRSVYASGKGASASGMTAAAVRDDFGETEWALEAGALVLANKGVACVDEIDKIDDDAVSSMHDALESQTVHVNKAGIDANLPAQTALLAAGNPKHGRFDQYEAFAEQIDLGPTLLSRFDLMFMVSDQPDEEEDRDISEHMIRTRRAAGKSQNSSATLSEEERQTVEPAIEPDVFRAYVAYAKQNVSPTVEETDVVTRLQDYYTDLRMAGGEEEDSPVAITPRQLEAIMRLAEASARVRLSETVNMSDVNRAIRLFESSMNDIGISSEDGEFDVDVIETGQSSSQRNRIKEMESLMADLCEDGPVRTEEVIGTAQGELEIEPDKARHTIQKFKDRGWAYNPDDDHIHWLGSS